MKLLETTQITAGYGKRIVLQDVTLQLERGERLLLIGPNGSGKSTLLKTLSGVIHPVSGAISFAERPLSHQSTDKRMQMGMGYLRQSRNIFPSLSVAENLDIADYHSSGRNNDRRERVLGIFPDLKKKLYDRAGTLSGGQRQSLAIAMVMMRPVDLMLFDEPTAGLSPKAASELLEAIHIACDAEKVSYIMVEHNLKTVQPWITRVVAMRQGRIVADEKDTKVLLNHNWLAGHYF